MGKGVVGSALAYVVSWGNAPFAIALGVVVVFALLQLTGILGLLAGGEAHDGASGADHEVEIDPDVEIDHDADAGDRAGDEDGSPGAHGARGALASAFGFGTLPVSMIGQAFALVAGLAGLVMNLPFFGSPGGAPAYSLWWAVPSSALAGAASVAALARVLGPVLGSKEQEATTRAELVGCMGVVISSKIDEAFGEIRIRDKTGHDLRIVSRLAGGAAVVPREGDEVVVVDCDERGGLLVTALDAVGAVAAPRRGPGRAE